ncbi:MAG: hypothetical protein ACO1TE_07965 [Prosthecobacter sp.]
MEEFNPYAAPKAEVLTQDSEAEATRRAHLNHEASIKSVGCLYALASLALLTVVIVGLDSMHPESVAERAKVLAQALLAGALAWGLRKLQRWAGIGAAIWAAVVMVLGIASLPVSAIKMVISAYVIFLMIGAKGRMVLSPDYRAIVAQTPHMKRTASTVSWVLFVLLLVTLVAILAKLFL